MDNVKANRLADILLMTGAAGFLLVFFNFGVSNGNPLVILVTFISTFYSPLAIIVGLAIKLLCSIRP